MLSRPRPAPAGIARGLLRLARFERDGVAAFDRGVPGVSASLAPLIALPLVLGLLALTQPAVGGVPSYAVLAQMLMMVVAVLAPLVISFELARRWDRLWAWPRYAAAIDWCTWLSPVAAMAAGIVIRVLLSVGAPMLPLLWGGLVAVVAYLILVHWFVARHALGVSGPRAALLVVAANGGAALLVYAPQALRGWLTGLAT